MVPLLSIIVPVYNVEDYLVQCLKSLISQIYPNVEIIVVDDGSTDSSGEICDSFSTSNDNVAVYHKENGGLSDARNYGFARSRGEYIAFLDSDDWAEPSMYSEMISLMEDNDAQLVCANYYVHSAKDCIKTNSIVNEGVDVMSGDDALRIVLSCGKIGNSINSKLYRRELIETNSFVKGLCFEDIVHTGSVLLEVSRLVFTSKPLWNYRIRSNSISHGCKENLYDAIKARGIRFHIISQVRPQLLQLLIKEYVAAFIYVMCILTKEQKYRKKNICQIEEFYKWANSHRVPFGLLQRIRLWVVLNNNIIFIRRINSSIVRCIINEVNTKAVNTVLRQ